MIIIIIKEIKKIISINIEKKQSHEIWKIWKLSVKNGKLIINYILIKPPKEKIYIYLRHNFSILILW